MANHLSRKETKQKNFETILDMGKKFFINYGTSNFSLQNFAMTLNMSPANFYNYFTSKRELWFAVLTREYSRDQESLLAQIKQCSGDIFEKISINFKYVINQVISDPDRYRMFYITEPPPLKSEVGPIEKKFTQTDFSYGYLCSLLDESIAKKEIIQGKPSHVYSLIGALTHGIARQFLNFTSKKDALGYIAITRANLKRIVDVFRYRED